MNQFDLSGNSLGVATDELRPPSCNTQRLAPDFVEQPRVDQADLDKLRNELEALKIG
jgi:hypothetical protein